MGGKNISMHEQKLGNVNLQTSCYGTVIPIMWGQARVTPNLIYYTDFKATPHTTSTQVGKGGSRTTNTTYTYSATIILAVSEGPVSFLNVFNNKSVGTAASFGFTTYPGTLTQAIWPYLQSKHPTDAYNFSGTAIAAQSNMALDSSATMGNYSFELRSTNFSIPDGQPGAPDYNPADIISDFLLNAYYGAVPGTLLSIADLTQYRHYCTAMGFFLSPVLDRQKSATEHLKDFLAASNSEIITSAGQLKVIPYGDTAIANNGISFVPNTTPQYDLTPSDFIVDTPGANPIKVKRSNPKDTFNCIPVEFRDRANNYNTSTVQVIEPVDAATFGLRTDTAKQLHSIVSPKVAQTISLIMAQRSIYIRNEYSFSLSWRYCLLEPMDLVTLTDPFLQFQRKVVRITKIKEDKRGRLQITAQEWPFGVASATAYSTQSSDIAPVNQLVDPGNVNTPAIFDYPTYLTSNGSAAIGVAGSGGPWWGGAQVYMSSDNSTYQYVGTIDSAGRYGSLSSPYPNAGPYDTTDILGVNLNVSNAPQLISIDAAYNADFANLALIDNELISYQSATLTGTGLYNLTNVYRGVLGTVEAAHSSGARFVRMDDKTIEIPITPARIGTTLYFKFISFNIFGQALQSLANVLPYLYVPNPGWSVTNTSEQFTVNGTVNGIAFTWGLGLLPGAYVVELYEGATPSAYAGGTAVQIWSGNATGKLIAKNDTTTRYYWIRARAQDGRYGAISPSGNGLPGHASLVTSGLVLSASPGTATSSAAATSQTTNAVSISVLGGTPAYTYAWSWNSGGSGLVITSATASSTTFSASGLALHETRTGTAKCVVTDAASNTQTIFVNVEIDEAASIPTATASPTSVAVSGASGSETTPTSTVTPSGGLAPYTYAWTWQSGGTSITITAPTSASTAFTNGALPAGVTLTGTALCTVTDSLGQIVSATVAVSITRTNAVGANASPTSETSLSTAANQTTGTTTVTATYGAPGYTYAWTWQSGGAGVSIDAPSSASTSFTAISLSGSGETRSGTALCTVTDSIGGTATATVTVSIQRSVSGMTASASPNTLNAYTNGVSGTPSPAATSSTTVSVTGGAPGYVYAWKWQSGGAGITINQPGLASTTFYGNPSFRAQLTGTAICTVTDSLGNVATTTVSVTLTNTF